MSTEQAIEDAGDFIGAAVIKGMEGIASAIKSPVMEYGGKHPLLAAAAIMAEAAPDAGSTSPLVKALEHIAKAIERLAEAHRVGAKP